MCRTPKEENLSRIAKDNSKLLDRIIVYINTELKLDLYKNYNNIPNNTKELEILKSKPFYRQTVKRLLNTINHHAHRQNTMIADIEKGNRILELKRSLTVTSVAYGNESSFNKGFKPNSQEKALIEAGEEEQRQKQRILKYELFMKSFEDNKELIKDFVELSPNNAGAEVLTRHYIYDEQFVDIARALNYDTGYIYILSNRTIDDLTQILMFNL